jgi:HTH-type transcriptional regulator / antitoxin HigA
LSIDAGGVAGDFPFTPTVPVPPGETLRETIEGLAMSEGELALRTNSSPTIIAAVIRGEAAITPEIAQGLERALGAPASFWLNRERHYRELLARQRERE